MEKTTRFTNVENNAVNNLLKLGINIKTGKTFEVCAKDTEETKPRTEAIEKLYRTIKLEQKTRDLAYLAVLAATERKGVIPLYVKTAKSNGATREEIIGSILIGLPAVGDIVAQVLPVALETYDEIEQ
ncbi:MAG: carboxymuconolactone decarboxylase family protein [Spirochaetaceae bacterium]|jgi:alkylhydroperoxidase/carboxymuconolactone decarboxylase family protein YurZ|nr:carboxymuconolactone decarboxylase family protein [Spirochaetaceae bacterium]